MINIQRKHKAPECLKEQKSYKCGDVVEKLEEDFHGKCYLCETDQFSVNVEHFTPHEGNKSLKFNWNNLFFGCEHCNNLKGNTIILDPTDPEVDVEAKLHYSSAFFPEHEVSITPRDTDDVTLRTADLLDKIYNGTTTIKTMGAAKLKQYLIREMIRFQTLLLNYEMNRFNDIKREQIAEDIKAELHESSKLTAFKRQIVKDTPKYRKEFGYLFEYQPQEKEAEK